MFIYLWHPAVKPKILEIVLQLTHPQVWTVYLGSDSPPLIRVVHQSLSGREHTFCVETKKRSFYLACRSDLELNRWIDRFVYFGDI